VQGVDFSNKNRNLQIGSYLQTLRLEQNLTLEQLSDLSQVPIIHLTSIEEGRFSRFDDFYLKIYLKRFTQSLDVDLEQLYTYASQQPLPDISESSANKQKQTERQMTETQANISATPKDVAKTNPQRRKPTLKAVNISRLEAKKKVGKFLTVLLLIILLSLIVFFFITIIRDLADRESSQVEPPPVLENPHEINGEADDDNDEENDEEDEEENDEEDEEESGAENDTSIEFDNHTDLTQTFTVVTSRDEIELRIEQSDDNWISLTSSIYNDLFERTFTLEHDESELRFTVGAIHAMDAMFINDIEVDFISSGLVGQQNFVFYIDLEE